MAQAWTLYDTWTGHVLGIWTDYKEVCKAKKAYVKAKSGPDGDGEDFSSSCVEITSYDLNPSYGPRSNLIKTAKGW